MKKSTPVAMVATPAIKKLKAAAEAQTGARPLTARSVAELCGVELKTVHNWAAEGLISHFRTPGRHLRFDAASVVRFLESCGYELPTERSRGDVLGLARGATRSKLRKFFEGDDTTWAEDLPTLLLRAGRRPPSLLVVADEELRQFDAPTVLRALRQQLPKTSILLVGGKGRSPQGVVRARDASVAELDNALAAA